MTADPTKKRAAKNTPSKKAPPQQTAPALDPAFLPGWLLLHQAMDLDQLWKAMIKLCNSAMPLHHMVAVLPFEGMAPMAMRTTVPHNNTEEFWQRLHAAEPPLFQIVRDHPGLKLADLDVLMTEEQIMNSKFYREIMQPDGWRYSVGLLFWVDERCVAHLGLCRTMEQGRFTPEEKQRLLAFHPYMDAAIRRVAQLARLELITGLLKEALEHPADGVTLIDSQGAVVFQNQAASICCAIWLRGKGSAAERTRPGAEVALPEDISRDAKDLMARFLEDFNTKSLKGKKYEKEIPHPGGLPVSARARVIIPNFRPVPPHVRIEFSRVPSDEGRGAGLPIYRLSEGEHRVALHVARGMRNDEVAAELGISVNTVRSHLREIFSKLSLTHRGQVKEMLKAGEPNPESAANAAHG